MGSLVKMGGYRQVYSIIESEMNIIFQSDGVFIIREDDQ